jgi:hypothetical protein
VGIAELVPEFREALHRRGEALEDLAIHGFVLRDVHPQRERRALVEGRQLLPLDDPFPKLLEHGLAHGLDQRASRRYGIGGLNLTTDAGVSGYSSLCPAAKA